MSRKLSYKIQVDASPEKVWDILADFGGVYKYSPGVRESHSLTTENSGVGAERICHLAPSGQVQERITEWHEGKDYSIEIYTGKGVPPFKHAIANLAVEPKNGGTEVTVTFDYDIKFGPVGAAAHAVMFGPFLNRGFQGLLSGLKKYAETGEVVQGAKGLEFDAVPA